MKKNFNYYEFVFNHTKCKRTPCSAWSCKHRNPFMLKAEDQIVGIATLQHSNIYPKDQTSKLTSVGTFSNPSLEKIVALKPSLVILSSYSLNLEEGLKKFWYQKYQFKSRAFRRYNKKYHNLRPNHQKRKRSRAFKTRICSKI